MKRMLTLMGLLGLSLASIWAQVFPIYDFESATLGQQEVMFRAPRFSGSTSSFLAATPNLSIVSSEQNHTSGGSQSLKVSWQFTGATNAWLRLTTFNANVVPNPALDFAYLLVFYIYVPSGTPDFYITLGVRDNGTTAPIGGNGGTTGGIEWVGSTTGAPPTGKLINQKDQWVQVVFDFSTDPIRNFAGGNGVLDNARGTLEHLAFKPVDPAQVGPYTLYLDDFAQIPEPASLSALALGVAGLLLRRRRRQ